jgi:hypothetical protein
VTLPASDRVQTLLAAARRIDEARIPVDDLGIRRPSLDDVFLALTAPATERRARVAPAEAATRRPQPSRVTA